MKRSNMLAAPFTWIWPGLATVATVISTGIASTATAGTWACTAAQTAHGMLEFPHKSGCAGLASRTEKTTSSNRQIQTVQGRGGLASNCRTSTKTNLYARTS
jgi:hypothetical protein